MNPLTKVKLINELNQREAQLGINEKVSWHAEYKDSAWIFIGGFPYDLTEGDIICVFSQYGEIANINLVRDNKTGKSKGFCFICYEDQRSTILAVDNFNGIKIKGRTIRVDHVANYRPPKDSEDLDEVTKRIREEGCAPKTPPPSSSEFEEEECEMPDKKRKKEKKEKKRKKKEKKEKKRAKEERRGDSDSRNSHGRVATPSLTQPTVKKEKEDSGYDKYASTSRFPDSERFKEDRKPWKENEGRSRECERGGVRYRALQGSSSSSRHHDGSLQDGKVGEKEGDRWCDSQRDSDRGRREDRHWHSEHSSQGSRNRERSDPSDRERSARGRDHSRDQEHWRN